MDSVNRNGVKCWDQKGFPLGGKTSKLRGLFLRLVLFELSEPFVISPYKTANETIEADTRSCTSVNGVERHHSSPLMDFFPHQRLLSFWFCGNTGGETLSSVVKLSS